MSAASFFPFSSRLFSARSKRSKTSSADTESAASLRKCPTPQPPPHTPALGRADKGPTMPLSQHRTHRAAAADSFLHIGSEKVVNTPRKLASWDRLPLTRVASAKPRHDSARGHAGDDHAWTQYNPCPSPDVKPDEVQPSDSSTYSRSFRFRKQTYPQTPYSVLYDGRELGDIEAAAMLPRSIPSPNKDYARSNTGSENERPLDLLEVLHGFFEADSTWHEPGDGPSAAAAAQRSFFSASTQNGDSMSTLDSNYTHPRTDSNYSRPPTDSNYPPPRTSFSSSITARLRRNSSKRGKTKPAQEADSPRLPIHQRPLPPIPGRDRCDSGRSHYLQLQPAIESPYLPRLEYQQESRPPSSLGRGSCGLNNMQDERRLSLPIAVRSQSITAHIMPPEERTRISGNRRPHSLSSQSSVATNTSAKASPDLDQLSPLPSSPFRSTFPYPPTGLHPPPRPRTSMPSSRGRHGGPWEFRCESPQYTNFLEDFVQSEG